jgi:hypothetical protein
MREKSFFSFCQSNLLNATYPPLRVEVASHEKKQEEETNYKCLQGKLADVWLITIPLQSGIFGRKCFIEKKTFY